MMTIMRTRKSINTGAYVFRSSLARKEYTDAITGGITALTMLEAAEALGADARFAFAATPQTTIGTDTTYTVDYETLYLVRDHLGSIRAITDSQGNILERNDYYPYGLQTDFGRNYPAGYKAGQFAVPYFITRKIFDTLDYGKERVKDLWTSFKCILHSEPKVSKAAQELGYGNGFVKYNKINTQERIHLWSY